MRVITCASYFGTGSSAVTDFCSEFDCVFSLGNYEYRFLQDPNGISDLEHHLIENNHRHNTSEAIKRYKKYVKSLKSFGYAGGYKVFNDKFDYFTDEYIKEITQLKVKNWFHINRIDRGQLFCYVDRAYSLVMKLTHGGRKTPRTFSLLQNREEAYYSAISEEAFLSATKKYVDNVLSSVNPQKPFIIVDQMVPPTNVSRYVRYFNDVKVVVVDRDPRDIYLSEKIIWQWGVIPVTSAEEFVEWFLITRKYSRPDHEDTEHVLRIQFEDLIYQYEETTQKIMSFIGFSKEHHLHPKEVFNPNISIKNTNLKQKIIGYEKEIKYIEDHLQDYLYDFEKML